MRETTRPHQPKVCGECKHWKKWVDMFQDAPVSKGVCETPFPLMFLTNPPDDGSYDEDAISTYATFGCNQWESNNATADDETV